MGPSEFVRKEMYIRLIKNGIASIDAEQIALDVSIKYIRKRFIGNVSSFIDNEVVAAKKIYGAKNK